MTLFNFLQSVLILQRCLIYNIVIFGGAISLAKYLSSLFLECTLRLHAFENEKFYSVYLLVQA